MHAADDAADGLEEAAFLMTHLTTAAPSGGLLGPVKALASLLLEGAQESVKMFEAASHVTAEGPSEDLQDFFTAADRIVGLEQAVDDAERAAIGALLTGNVELRTFYILSRLAQALEGAADGLSLSALKLRDHLLNDVLGK
jgi:uncharacterized protein Yka (UPF0111/DUF47 family)